MFNLLKSNQTFVLILIPLIIAALWFRTFYIPSAPIHDAGGFTMPLYKLVSIITGDSKWLTGILGLVLFIIQILLIVKLNKDYILIDIRTYLPAIIFILVGCSFRQVQQFEPVLFANIFILLAVNKILQSYRDDSLFTNFFDASVLISLGSLFYFNTIFLFILVWSGLIILRQFSMREWLLSVTGLVTPYLFALSFFYIYGNVPDLFSMIAGNFIFDKSFEIFNLYSLIYLIYLAVLILLSSINIIKKYNKMKISIRKYYKFLFWMFVYSIVIFFAAPNASVEILLITAVPVSFVFTNYLVSIKKESTSSILLLMLMALIVLLQINI